MKEARTHTGQCSPASPTRLSRRQLALARFARFGPPGSPTLGLRRHFLKNLKKSHFFYSKRPPSPAKTEVLYEKKCRFLTKKDLPASQKTEFLHEKMTKKCQKKVPKRPPRPAKTEVLHEKNCLFLLKKPPSPAKNWRILKKNPDPQLYQTFKPIKKFFLHFFTHIAI